MFETNIRERVNVDETDSHDDDEKLVLSAKKNLSDFKKIYEKWLDRVYRYCYFRVGSKKDAEDLTSQVFLKAYEGLPSYRHRGYFAAWLFSIARARVADFYRKKKNELPLVEAHEITDESNLSFQIAEKEILDEVLDLINCLSEKDQELLRLRFVAELTYREIGVIFHRREDSVRKGIWRVLARIRNEVNHE